MQITLAMPPLNFYFMGLIFMVCQSTAKTAKIGPLKISHYTVSSCLPWSISFGLGHLGYHFED